MKYVLTIVIVLAVLSAGEKDSSHAGGQSSNHGHVAEEQKE